MRCVEAREQLYLKERSGTGDVIFPADAGVAQAQTHVAGCGACQAFFAADERLRNLVKSRAPREQSPASLRESLLARVAHERKASEKRARRFSFLRLRNPAIAVAAMIVIVATVTLRFSNRRPVVLPEQLASVLIDDHAHNLPDEAEVSSPNHEVVQSWFEGKLDFSFHLPATSDQALIGGRLCNLQGKRAALIFYKEPRNRTSLFVFDGSDIILPENQLVGIDGKHCMIDSKKGYNAVMWKERGVLYSLVSDARSTDLLQLAAQF
jgi:anti-sigma factor RsiW